MDPADHVLESLRSGDRRALARSITLVESTRADHRAEAAALVALALPYTGRAVRIGITGPPGVGKSTFIEALGLHVLSLGHRLAVLTVDPSSARSGGSILGDKTRMVELARQPDVFIRPSPGGSHLGGVARRTREAMLLCEAAGYDVVFVETIGVGQSEVEVAGMVDLFCMLVNPGSGDDLQGIKRGITELADLVVVNKADGDLAAAAGRTQAAYGEALGLISPRWRAWSPRAISCSSLERDGIDAVWSAIESFTAAVDGSGERQQRRGSQALTWMWSEIRDELLDDFKTDRRVTDRLPVVVKQVEAGDISATEAARRLLDVFEDPGGAGAPDGTA